MEDRPKLYGVQGFKEHAGGAFNADQWAKLRAGEGGSGRMTGHENNIMWFKDPGARAEFQSIFGGQNVTLHPKTNNDQDALQKAAKEMLRGTG
jgi:hypothetical protein